MKLIEFIPSQPKNIAAGYPEPGKSHVPKWYKEGEIHFTTPDGDVVNGMKSCVPFLDVMISGYMLTTPTDIHVTINEDGKQKLGWDYPGPVLTERPAQMGATIPRPAGHSVNGLIWESQWGWKTPRGWSVLVTHPYNRFDLPFITVSGFMESDKFISNGNIPFFIREGFEGIIPKGTPYAQLIPVKRASWTHRHAFELMDIAKELGKKVHLNTHFYKKFNWVRKIYE